MKSLIISFLFFTQVLFANTHPELEKYFSLYSQDPSSFECTAQSLEIANQILPNEYNKFNLNNYKSFLNEIYKLRKTYPMAVSELLMFIQNRWTNIYSEIYLDAQQTRFNAQASLVSGAVPTVGVAVSYLTKNPALNIIKSPWVRIPSILISTASLGGFAYVVTKNGWSLNKMPASPIDTLGYDTQGFSETIKNDSNDLIKYSSTLVTYPALNYLINHLITDKLSCTTLFQRLNSKLGPRTKLAASFLGTTIKGTIAYTFISAPLIDYAQYKGIYNDYNRALKQTEENSNDSMSVELELSKRELYTRMLELDKILKSKHYAAIEKQLKSENKNFENLTPDELKKIYEEKLQHIKIKLSPMELKTLAWINRLDANPDEFKNISKEIVDSVQYQEIDNSALLWLYTASVLNQKGLEPKLSNSNLLLEAFTEAAYLKLSMLDPGGNP
jgi:hypothetical protein